MPRWPPISGSGKKPALIQKQTIGYSPALTRAGKHPFWPDIVLQKIIRPAALRAGITKAIRVAHISPLLLLAPSGQRRECEGGAGTDAARQQSSNTRGLFAGAECSEAASSRTGCPDDPSCAAGGCGTRNFLR